MRADANKMTGNLGETEAMAKFERLGWAVVMDSRHDLGTDLWLRARDVRRFELGLLVGAQVKSGPTAFSEKVRDAKGAVTGWWFRDDDRRHIDAWLAHAVPHLLVLHDAATSTSYWVHVTQEAVKEAGKGAKILVPASNTVDESHRDQLLRVAASQKPGGAWEGSAWTGATAVVPSALMRHALIVPRLIAPHPNADRTAGVSAPQALALLLQVRIADLHVRSEKHDSVPSLEEAGTSADWGWRLVGAFGRRVLAGEHAPLVEVATTAPDPALRTAAAVAAAATMLEDGLADEALEVLDAALARDDADPVDQAWLEVQRARACAEVGRIDEARDFAARAQIVGATSAEDVTATAIAGIAALLLFNTSDWWSEDLAGVITGADTTVAWWRTQTVAQGLTSGTEREFRTWSRDTTMRITTGDPANDRLLSAAMTATYAGDHSAWRHLSGLLAQDRLLRLGRNSEPAVAAEALESLVKAGRKDDINQAVRRLADDGPAQAVTLAMAQVDLERVTGTTATGALTLLERGGDLLDDATADRTVRWLLATLDDPEAFTQRTRPNYPVTERLVNTLAAVAPAATAPIQHLVAERVAALPLQTDDSLAMSWARAVDSLPSAAWDADSRARAGASAADHHKTLGTRLLAIAAAQDSTIRPVLLSRASDGDLDALSALGDVTDLPTDVARAAIHALVQRIREQIAYAAMGLGVRVGVANVGHGLVILNTWHPNLADWPPLLELFADPRVAGRHKRSALLALAANVDRIREELRSELLQAATAVQPRHALSRLPGEDDDAWTAAAEAISALQGSSQPEQLVRLLAGDQQARASAARIAKRLRRPQDTGILLVLAADPDSAVRAAAAVGLAEFAADGLGGQPVLAALTHAAQDAGRRVPESIAAALSDRLPLPRPVQRVLTDLQRHPSARVRRATTRLPTT